jgi:SulP family sulfate permease
VATGNLAIGVTLGVLTAMVAFARRVAHLTIVESDHRTANDHSGTRVYRVRGELFFASSNDLLHQFDYVNDPDDVLIDMSDTDIWDASAVASLDAIRNKYQVRGKTLRISGLDGASLERLNRLSGRLGV